MSKTIRETINSTAIETTGAVVDKANSLSYKRLTDPQKAFIKGQLVDLFLEKNMAWRE